MPQSAFESLEGRKGSGCLPDQITGGYISLSLRPTRHWSKRTLKKKKYAEKVINCCSNFLEKIRLHSKWGFMLCKIREKGKRGGVQCVKEENCVITDLPLFQLFSIVSQHLFILGPCCRFQASCNFFFKTFINAISKCGNF